MSEVIELNDHRTKREVNRRVGMNVKIAMMMRGVGQPALAAALGVTQPSVSRRLSGHTPWTPDELEAAATLLGVSIGRLFEKLPGLDSNQEPIGLQLGELIYADFGA
jgi:transcriptional regulator with XRE-family HTH domain